MRFTEQTRYAIRVLVACAERYPGSVRAADLAVETGITEFNIFKLFKTITRAGFVETIRGRSGGVRLAVPPSALSLGQVVRALEPRFQACGPAALMREPGERIDALIEERLGLGVRAALGVLDGISIGSVAEQKQTLDARDTMARGASDAGAV